MVSLTPNRPVQFRAKAQEARDRAQNESDEGKRRALLNDAELWDRMADYEDKNPSHNFQSYYPKE